MVREGGRSRGEERKEKRDGERKRQKEIETLDKTRRLRKLEGLEN